MKMLFKILLVLGVATTALFMALPDQHLHVHFLDVGQGDSIFIKTPLNQKIIIDGGPDLSLIDKLHTLITPFEKEIDLIVLSHPHRDHMYGFLELLNRYEVKAVLMTGISYGSSDYRHFLERTEKADIYLADENQDFNFGAGVYLDVLYPKNPSIGREIENVNNDSIVLKLVYGEHSILFTGDSEEEQEQEMLKLPFDYSADILKAGHHGSRTSTSQQFLDAVNPNKVIISAGKDNPFDHPHPETLEKLRDREVLRTDLDGDIEFVFKS